MVVNSNLTASLTADNLALSQGRLSRSLARISSGNRIVTPGDDAAGLAVGTKLDARVHRIDGAKANVGNATSFVQTQDGYLKKIATALDRMSELSLMSQDATKSDEDRLLYDKEFGQLKEYIVAAGNKEFNGVSLFSPASLDVTIDSEGGSFKMAGIDLATAPYSTVTAAGSGVGTVTTAKLALADVKSALTRLASDRASIGAYQARLDYSAEELMVSRQNLTAAASRIQDTDVANESTEFARASITVQSGTAMLAQANQLPQAVLRLLQ